MVKLKEIIKSILPLPIFAVLLIVSIIGLTVVRDRDIYRKIMPFELRPYKYGLYITVPGSTVFYNISPYDAYSIDQQGNKKLLITWEQNLPSQESRLIYRTSKRPTQVYYALLSYFKFGYPHATFVQGDKSLVLGSTTIGNNLFVNVGHDDFDNLGDKKSVIMAINYNDDDLVFDSKGNLYNYADQSVIDSFNKIFSFNLKSAPIQNQDVAFVPADTNYLFIENSKFNGIMRFPINGRVSSLSSIYLKGKIIEFNALDRTNPQIEIQLFDNLKEALK
jgi:hypothetical protein